ncbi:hypothetical protein [Pyrobaculum sp.]|uniref:hypothetical protein n=1 Tax=Pyrobaculum sp. TaxID=2004705 RepID=UPI00316FA8CA
MSLRVVILKEGEEVHEGDVVIDARGSPQFYDVIILSGRELRSIIATGAVEGGVPIGIGKYTKKPVASVVGSKIYIKGIPLSLYIEAGLLEKELLEALRKSGLDIDTTLRQLKEIVVAERRRYKKSPTLATLKKYLDGEESRLPPHLEDLLSGVDRDTLKKLFERLIDEVY